MVALYASSRDYDYSLLYVLDLFQLETPLYMYIGNTANIVIC